MTRAHRSLHLGIGALALLAVAGTAAAAQDGARKVLAKRVCPDGATTTVSVTGDLVLVEFWSAPDRRGLVSGYEDAYDLRDFDEARAQFHALACPGGPLSD